MDLCNTCFSWDETQWQGVPTYDKKLEKKHARKKELRVQKRASESFSGFSNISSVSNVSLVSSAFLLMEESLAPSGELAAGPSAPAAP